MSIHERIREIRQALGLSQAKFAKDISISSGYVAGLELGNRKVNDRMIKLICTQYNVNEAWLRDGTGEMFRSASDSRLERSISLSFFVMSFLSFAIVLLALFSSSC